MTHDIERYEHHVGGEALVWEFTITEDRSNRDITGASIEWYLLERRGEANTNAVLDHNDSGVEARIEDAASGRVDVDIDSGTTEQFAGSMKWQRLIVEDSAGNVQIWNGPFPIQER